MLGHSHRHIFLGRKQDRVVEDQETFCVSLSFASWPQQRYCFACVGACEFHEALLLKALVGLDAMLTSTCKCIMFGGEDY